MTAGEPAAADQGAVLLALYDRALPQVYGYLLPRTGAAPLAEDLTAETFLTVTPSTRCASWTCPARHGPRSPKSSAAACAPPSATRPLEDP